MNTLKLKDILELLVKVPASELGKYTELIKGSLVVGNSFRVRGTHRVDVRQGGSCSQVSCRNYHKWIFSGSIDTDRVVDISITVGKPDDVTRSQYSVVVELVPAFTPGRGRLYVMEDDDDPCDVFDMMFALAKKLPEKSVKKFTLDEKKREKVVASLKDLQKVLKETGTRLVRTSEGTVTVVPKKVTVEDTDKTDEFDFVDSDFYPEFKIQEIPEIGWGFSYAIAKRKEGR